MTRKVLDCRAAFGMLRRVVKRGVGTLPGWYPCSRPRGDSPRASGTCLWGHQDAWWRPTPASQCRARPDLPAASSEPQNQSLKWVTFSCDYGPLCHLNVHYILRSEVRICRTNTRISDLSGVLYHTHVGNTALCTHSHRV